jgi:hypothetical protein
LEVPIWNFFPKGRKKFSKEIDPTNKLVKGWKNVFQGNGPYKQAGVAIVMTEEVDFRLKSIRRNNEGHFILMKGTIHKEEILILNINALNTGELIYVKKKKRKKL